jgi:hypothetical protein
MAFCRYCGKELVNGQCDCAMSKRQQAASQQKSGNMQVRKPEPHFSSNNYENSYQNGYQDHYQDQGRYQDEKQYSYQQPYQKIKEPFFVESFNLDFSSFSGFISSLRDQSGIGRENRNGNPYEQNVPIVPDCIEPEANEVIIKQYNLCKMRTRIKFMKAEGRLMITNRRVLFRAAGTSLTGHTLQEHQFNIDEIGGIQMNKDYKFSFFNFILCQIVAALAYLLVFMIMNGLDSESSAAAFGIILGIVGILPTFIIQKHFWLKYFWAQAGAAALTFPLLSLFGEILFSNKNAFLLIVMLLIALINAIVIIINIIILCFIPNFRMEIKTKGASGALVIRGTASVLLRLLYPLFALSQKDQDYCGFEDVMPWEDTVMAINEVGTMIDDIQKNGDYAIEKWSK